jgi:hypothetical protein
MQNGASTQSRHAQIHQLGNKVGNTPAIFFRSVRDVEGAGGLRETLRGEGDHFLSDPLCLQPP